MIDPSSSDAVFEAMPSATEERATLRADGRPR